MGKAYLLKKVQSTGFKVNIITHVNKKVDIPKLNEKQEAQLFNAIYDAIMIYFV